MNREIYEFQDFSAITQILREIKFGNFGVSKPKVLTKWVTHNLDVLAIFDHFQMWKFVQKSKFTA